MERFSQEAGSLIVDRLILAIQENKQYLSDIDGAIGDGDHGINMNKGFTLCREGRPSTVSKRSAGMNSGRPSGLRWTPSTPFLRPRSEIKP